MATSDERALKSTTITEKAYNLKKTPTDVRGIAYIYTMSSDGTPNRIPANSFSTVGKPGSGTDSALFGSEGSSVSANSLVFGKRCSCQNSGWGQNSMAGGLSCSTHMKGCVALGELCTAGDGDTYAGCANALAMGWKNHARAAQSYALGENSEIKAGASDSITVGEHCYCAGKHSAAFGNYSKTNADEQFVCGRYNTENSSALFIVGMGSNDSSRSNAMVVLNSGVIRSKQSFQNGGADYAEMFEWEDGNPTKQDRVGYFVKISNGEKISKCDNLTDVIGVVSVSPSIIGDNPIEWHDKYLTDEWGRIKTQPEPIVEVKYNENGERYEVVTDKTKEVPMINPLYNEYKEYNSRSDRSEWAPVGLLGKLLVRQDGTLSAGCKCKPDKHGEATFSEDGTGYLVLSIVNTGIAKILFK